MKLVAYILTLLVFCLSVKSGIGSTSLVANAEKPCCSVSNHNLTPETKNTEDHSENTETCNPFQACCSCLLICISSPFLPAPQIDISTEQYFNYQSFLASQFISDFWQPPQFV
ncbi:hypothetical protein [Formosa haliotis]|uniref:hypothetical protein n=1 Tax=Formosa haliotis TaxID=1555194 RepID=UPI00082708AD|nr:hypothetical protein [Formosa haliotis]